MGALTDAPNFAPGMRADFPLRDLHESDDNPRWIDDEALDRLKYALTQDPHMLQARPVICTEHGEVVCGNMRLRAASELGWTTIPTFVHHFASEAEKREWMLRDNQEYGDWVPDQLAQMIARHAQEGADTKLLGFNDEDVMKAIRRASGEAIVPEPSEPPDPKLGAEAMVEIRCTREALAQIQPTLEDWQDTITGLEVAVSQ